MFKLFLIWRYFLGESRMVKITSALASLGIILGVACLVVSMSVVSGVQRFIQDSIIDLYGHILVHKPGAKIESIYDVEKQIRQVSSEIVGLTPYVTIQGVAVKEGHVYGIVLQGLQEQTMSEVLNLKPRVLSGEFDFSKVKGKTQAVLGKEAVRKLNLKLGDEFSVIVPRPSRTKMSNFSPAQETYILAGVMDFGKFDYNEKVLVTSAESVQNLSGIGDEYLGFYIKIKDADKSKRIVEQLRRTLGEDYRIRDWEQVNINFFTAVKVEKIVIFIVVLFIVIVASFNISSTLLVSVVRKFSDIAVLRTLGAPQKFMKSLFTIQGLVLGFIGSTLGISLGLLFCFLIQKYNIIDIPGDIYKFDRLPVEIRGVDVTVIFFVTLVICYLSSLIPAARGANLNPVEGLRYE